MVKNREYMHNLNIHFGIGYYISLDKSNIRRQLMWLLYILCISFTNERLYFYDFKTSCHRRNIVDWLFCV